VSTKKFKTTFVKTNRLKFSNVNLEWGNYMKSSLHILSFRKGKKGVGAKMTMKVNWWDRQKKGG